MTSEHSTLNLTIPELGEGLRSVIIRQFYASPGDNIEQDQDVYQIETHKALFDVSSPHAGVLQQWHYEINDTVAVGERIATIQHLYTDAGHKTQNSNAIIPNKIQLYATEQGLTHADIKSITPAVGHRVNIHDIDNYVAKQSKQLGGNLSDEQQRFIARCHASEAIPSTISIKLKSDIVFDAHIRLSYQIIEKLLTFPRFYYLAKNNKQFYQNQNLVIGHVFSADNDELLIKKIVCDKAMNQTDYIEAYAKLMTENNPNIEQAANVIFTYLGEIPYMGGTPVLVNPAIMTVNIGGAIADNDRYERVVSFTFDHRYLNGMHLAALLQAITNDKQSHIQSKVDTKEALTTIIHSYLQSKDLAQASFIELGLSSKSAISMINEIAQVLTIDVPVTWIWKYPLPVDFIHQVCLLHQNEKHHD